MRQFTKYLLFILVIAAIVSLLPSCNTETPIKTNGIVQYMKGKVLENNSTTYVILEDLHYAAYDVFSVGDTVWVNMSNHHIDDVDSNAMMVVLVK